MKRKSLSNLLPVLSLALALTALIISLPGLVGAQGLGPQATMDTAFTYQGRLTDGDSPANGTYDFRFIVYDNDIGGSQVGGVVITKEDVTVTNGFFSVELDFGSDVFTGGARWLEIKVRPGDSSGGYTTFDPRQPLMPAPYALYASSAGDADMVDGQHASAFVEVAGDTMTGTLNLPSNGLVVGTDQLVVSGDKVGIGTTNPGAALEVNGPFIRTIARATGLGPHDSTDSGQIAGRVLTFTKAKADTAIRVSYTDNLRPYGGGGPAACRWEIRVDDVSCPGGALFYDYLTQGPSIHRSNTVVGYCEGLGVGTFEIQVWVGSTPGFSGDCYTGWNNSRWVLEAEEVY